jgi:hypothetical protein
MCVLNYERRLISPCNFALFPKLKTKLKGQRFKTVSDNQRESQVVHDSIKENDFHSASEAQGEIYGIAAYAPKQTILKSMAAKIEKVTPAFLI